MRTQTVSTSVISIFEENPNFRLVKAIPEGLSSQIERAVQDFIKTSHVPAGVDLSGFYYSTLQTIANIAVMNAAGEFWLGTIDGELVTYILAHVGNDYDGRLSYTVTQAWVRKDQRGQRWVKEAWEKVRQRAKDCLCKHFSVFSSRSRTERETNAYCRFLGKGFHKYCEILKEEI